MKSTIAMPRSWTACVLGTLFIAACARTPLDSGMGQAAQSESGTGGASVAGSGGANVGGAGKGGATFATGGAWNTLEVLGSGGAAGHLGSGGGSGGIGTGGRRGGNVASGGTPGFAGNAGGTVTVARGGSGGTTRFDGGLGGNAGGGRDGSYDARDLGRDRTDTLATVGSGGRGGGTGSGGSATCPATAGDEELIDDLNDGDRYLPRVNGRVGAWSDGNDHTPGGTMYPDPSTTFTPTDTGDACWQYAVYVKGTGFTDGGANFWFGLGAPYDASKYSGISFWAKSDAGTQNLRALFPDKDTDPDAGLCKTAGNTNQCYDHYGFRMTIAPGWNRYTVSFKNLTQDGWGRQGTAFDPSSLFQIFFQFPANATFALWLDNIAFTL